ncbi:hypothetical protein DKT75_01460 [Leucothrix arctica]|uniref:Uncharacterized protein n=2 Tax=Leucothrix arctica TaxID=1481894 RepID=A0A317CLZ3_9GAMM|nr:hypothetical protein DKT75_01460 [Leucothrix arctica]
MEWEYGTWTGSFAGFDEVGRQLGEANVLPEWLASPLDDKWTPFRGPGSRKGHPYNIDAFKEMGHCWNDLLLDAATIRHWYSQRYLGMKKTLNARDLFIISSICVSIPSFLLRRKDDPTADGNLPRQSAAGFKVIGGMYAATSRMVSQAHPLLEDAELDVEAFLVFLEDERLLLSPESRACAAPANMIRQILNALINPASDIPVDQGFAYLNDDIERAFDYGVMCARLDLSVLLHWQGLRYYLQMLVAMPEVPLDVIDYLQADPELSLEGSAALHEYVSMTQSILEVVEKEGAEQALIAVLPTEENNASVMSLKEIGVHCFELETVMRKLVCTQQVKLDQILQKSPSALSIKRWSPAPGSLFLKQLFKIAPQLTGSIRE